MKSWMMLMLALLLSTAGLMACSLTAAPEQETLMAYDLTDLDGDGVVSERDTCLDSVANEAVDNEGCGDKKYQVLQQDIIILFDNDKSIIKPKYQGEINAMARFMALHRDLKLLLEGHTSKVGTEPYNLALSKRRAETVREALMKAGVDSHRLQIIGFGATHPLLMGENEQVAAANRRVVGSLTSLSEGVRLRWNVYD